MRTLLSVFAVIAFLTLALATCASPPRGSDPTSPRAQDADPKAKPEAPPIKPGPTEPPGKEKPAPKNTPVRPAPTVPPPHATPPRRATPPGTDRAAAATATARALVPPPKPPASSTPTPGGAVPAPGAKPGSSAPPALRPISLRFGPGAFADVLTQMATETQVFLACGLLACP